MAKLDDNDKIKSIINSKYKGKFLYVPIIMANLKSTKNQNIIINQYENLDKCVDDFTTLTDKQFKANIFRHFTNKTWVEKIKENSITENNLLKFFNH